MPIAGAGAKKKRKQFSLQEKVDLFKEIDAGKKQIDLCRERGIAPSTLATILKDREKVLKLHRESQLAPTRKRLRLGNFQDVDQAVLTWFKDARLQNVPVSGPMLQEKAREFADALEVTGFDASSGWLFRFRQRNGITWQVVSGEEKAADKEGADSWRNDRFRGIAESYSEDDIFNADETACFYQLLPDRTMHFKGQQCKGGKKSHLRVTVLLCCNASGTKKIKPLVIGKYAKPRCLKNVVSLPYDYRANKRAWMTRELFSEWLLKLDDQMRKENRKILLIVDNCSAHIVNVRLTHVRLEFLPPNNTSLLQPLDQGIIKSVKVEFRKRLVQRLIINLRLKQPTSINVRQAAEMLTGAWWNVKTSTISNCWRKAGLRKAPEQLEDDLEENHSTPGDLWTEVEELLPDVSSFDDYVESDCAALTSADLTTEEIVNSVRDVSSDDDDPKDEESMTPNTEADESVTHSDVLVHMDKVRTYIGRCSDVPDEVLRQVEGVEAYLISRLCSARQKKITDFFK